MYVISCKQFMDTLVNGPQIKKLADNITMELEKIIISIYKNILNKLTSLILDEEG